MSKQEFAEQVAKLVAGLQVPVSLPGSRERLGAAYEPWQALFREVNGSFGWTNARSAQVAFEKILNA